MTRHAAGLGSAHPGGLADEAGVVLLPDADGAGAALLVQDGRGHCSTQQVSGGGTGL